MRKEAAYLALMFSTFISGCVPLGRISISGLELQLTPTNPFVGRRIQFGEYILRVSNINRRFLDGEPFLIADVCSEEPMSPDGHILLFGGEIESENSKWIKPYQTVLIETDRSGNIIERNPIALDGLPVVSRDQLRQCR